MLQNVPLYISILFVVTSLSTLLLFNWTVKHSSEEKTRNQSGRLLLLLSCWLLFQAFLSFQNVYNSHTNTLPPKIIVFGVLPAMLSIVLLFSTAKGREFIDNLPLKHLAYLNLVRIPVELVLYGLFLYKAIPQIMTFEGQNFDILAGITAPIIAYFGLTKHKIKPNLILLWHLVSLGLLVNIVQLAFRAAPSPLQQIAFEQPNIAILYFPFCWLPTFIVPLVLLGHLISIRQLLKNRKL